MALAAWKAANTHDWRRMLCSSEEKSSQIHTKNKHIYAQGVTDRNAGPIFFYLRNRPALFRNLIGNDFRRKSFAPSILGSSSQLQQHVTKRSLVLLLPFCSGLTYLNPKMQRGSKPLLFYFPRQDIISLDLLVSLWQTRRLGEWNGMEWNLTGSHSRREVSA